MLVIAVVTLLVVGPKDLPKVIRAVAGGIGKMRRMVGEFKSGVDDFVRESELSELREAVDKTRAAMDLKGHIKKTVDPDGTLDKLISPVGIPDKPSPSAGQSKGAAGPDKSDTKPEDGA